MEERRHNQHSYLFCKSVYQKICGLVRSQPSVVCPCTRRVHIDLKKQSTHSGYALANNLRLLLLDACYKND